MQGLAKLTEINVKINFIKVGYRIQSGRKLRRMTQNDFVSICNCSSNHLSAIENGTNKPLFEIRIKIRIVLDKSMDYFLMDSSHVSRTCR